MSPCRRGLRLAGLGLAALAASPAVAQDLGRKAPPQPNPVAIVDAAIYPVSGPVVERGTIWFEGGGIRGVGPSAEVAVPADAIRIDGRGKRVYPGLISAVTTLGLVEIGSLPETRDERELGELTPEAAAAVAVNPDSTAIPVARSNGVLAAGVFPTGGLISGRAAVVQLDGWTWENMAVLPDAGPVVAWPALPREEPRRRRPRSRPAEEEEEEEEEEKEDPAVRVAEQRRAIEDAFEDARAYLASRAADPSVPVDVRWEALQPALAGERPVFVRAADREAIESAVSWAARARLRLVLVGGRDAPACGAMLARHDVAVVITGTHVLPARRDSGYDEPFRLPSLLEAAGLRWCLATTGNHANERNLPYHAATAVAYGLEPDAALRAITLAPAEILGVGDHLGSLEVGKWATLMVTDGDPLEIVTKVERAFIRGREVDLRNKQTELAEKYKEKYRQLGLWGK